MGSSALAQPSYVDLAQEPGSGIVYQRTPSPRNEIFEAQKAGILLSFDQFPFVPILPRGLPGVALLDFDGDGDLDIYATNGPGSANSLFSNQLLETGSLTFLDVALLAGVDATDQDSSGTCFGDVDNDGDEDLVVLGTGMPTRLFENQGDGTFVDISASSGIGGGDRHSTSCSLGDVNGDGLLDLFVANAFSPWENQLAMFVELFGFNEPNQLFLNTGGNVFQDASASSGILELAGLPPSPTPLATVSLATAMVDYDLDGDLDILHADDQGRILRAKYGGVDRGFVHLFRNDGTGHFTDMAVAAGTAHDGGWMGLSFGDLNCDGYLDFFASNAGDYLLTPLPFPHEVGDWSSRWFLGQPDGTFLDPGVGSLVATPWGWGTSMVDYDNDGDADILYHGGLDAIGFVDASNPGALLQNQGCSASFVYDDQALATDHSRRNVLGSAAGDLNGDGSVDFVSVSNFDFPPPIPVVPFPVAWGSPFDFAGGLVPTFAPTEDPNVLAFTGIQMPNGSLSVEVHDGAAHPSVTVRTLGTRGLTSGGVVNRDGIGAVIWFTPRGGTTAIRPVVGGSSFASQDGLDGLFGMGESERGEVEVLWPGGVRNRLYNIKAGEKVLLPEIPCSFDGAWPSRRAYAACLDTALDGLVDNEVIDAHDRARLLLSAIRAFNESQR